MNLLQLGATATTTLVAVLLGAWLTQRAQDRLWQRDRDRQWRDIRLATYSDFLTAFREYVAFALQPGASIVAVPRPRGANDLMPFFDEKGTPYKEKLEATKSAIRLVADRPGIVSAANSMVHQARSIAAARAEHEVAELPPERFETLWAAEREFLSAARAELGLDHALELRSRLSLSD